MQSETAMVLGSVSDITRQTGTVRAPKVVVLLDASGSMMFNPFTDGPIPFDVACAELEKFQAQMPGQVVLLTFSSEAQFHPSGIPSRDGENTSLAPALRMAKDLDTGKIRFVVISDGELDDFYTALDLAYTFRGQIDGIFVGYGAGLADLQRVTRAGHGRCQSINIAALSDTMTFLLND